MVDAISPSENTNSEEVSASIEGQYTPWSEAHLKERVLRAEQEAFRLQPLQERAQANKNSLEKQVDTLSIREQEEIWRGIFASPEVQNSYPLLKQLGIIDLTLQQAPMDPKGKVRTASKLKFWDNSYRTNEQNFVSLIEEKLGIRIEHNPIIKSMGIVSQSGNEIYMQYSRSMPSIRDRLLAFGEHGLIDVWTSMIGHEFVHVRKDKRF